MPDPGNLRPLEPAIIRDLSGKQNYSEYLNLSALLDLQQPLSVPPNHDEMLFIIQHHIAELWIKLLIHEIMSASAHIANDALGPCFKILARAKLIQTQLYEQWAVLETLTPNEFLAFRSVFGTASGFQSAQYRKLEFLMGNKNRELVEVFSYDPPIQKDLLLTLESPSIYDQFLRHLARRGLPIPESATERDWSLPYQSNPAITDVFATIYGDPHSYWDAYELCEKLVDVEEYFQLWRFRHMKTVERVIGFKRGSGGSSGVGFLKRALELRFFPELLDVRTVLLQK
jgi:tryptophan 2,3-dioxygenase